MTVLKKGSLQREGKRQPSKKVNFHLGLEVDRAGHLRVKRKKIKSLQSGDFQRHRIQLRARLAA